MTPYPPAAGPATAAGPAPPGRARVLAVISSVIREILPAVDPAAITGGRHLRDLGADSVDRVEIIIAVLDRLGLDQPLSAFGSLPDIDAMVSLLGELSAGQPAAGGPPGARREGRPG